MAIRDPGPAAAPLIDLIAGIPDDLLDRPTPCDGFLLGDLLGHIGLVAVNYTAAARRTAGADRPEVAWDDTPRLGVDWRTRIPRELRLLVRAWQDPAAWEGTAVRADGCELTGDFAGLIVCNELLVHGWDVARSVGRPYAADPGVLQAAHDFIAPFAEAGQEARRQGLFGPVVAVPDHAPLLDGGADRKTSVIDHEAGVHDRAHTLEAC